MPMCEALTNLGYGFLTHVWIWRERLVRAWSQFGILIKGQVTNGRKC
jgi:hypothetical protein